MESGIMKTSAVLIVSDEIQARYPSVRDVPEPLRTRLVECTTGRNSGTIVIADRRGKEEIEKAARFEQITSSSLPAPRAYLTWNHLWPALVALTVGVAGAWLAFLVRW